MAIEDIQEIRRTLQNLLPGSRYATRVRALNEFGQYSPWSEALEFTAEGSVSANYDLVAPPAPTIQPQIEALTVLMSYTAQNDGITLYVIEHSYDNVSFSEIVRTPIPLYVHLVGSGQTHYYRFKVVDIYGTESPVSPSNSGQSLSAISFKPYATVVIAASDSSADGKENADFVCDGVDDQIQFQAAALVAGGYGKVVMLEGSYYFSDFINDYIDNLEGQGRETTWIYLVNDMGALDTECFDCGRMSGFTIQGQATDTNESPVITGELMFISRILSDVSINGLKGNSWAIECGDSSLIENVRVDVSMNYCIYAGEDAMLLNSYFYCADLGQYGCHFNTDNISIVGCHFDGGMAGAFLGEGYNVIGNTFEGTWVKSDDTNTFVGNNFIDGNRDAQGVALEVTHMNVISGNHFNNAGILAWSHSTITGNFFFIDQGNTVRAFRSAEAFTVNLEPVMFSSNTVSTNHFSGTTIAPIRVDNSVSNTLIHGNNILTPVGQPAFSDAGIDTNYGSGNYVNGVWVIPSTFAVDSDKFYQHNQGSSSTTWTVAHNLGKFPSVIAVDGTDTQIFPGSVVYDDNNQVTLTFSSAQSGKAYCN